MNTFLLKIVTPSSEFYTGEVNYLCIDTPDGKLGFLRGAIARVGLISRGVMEISTSVLKMRAVCGDGIYKVDKDGVLILVDSCAFEGDDGETFADREDVNIDNAKVQIASMFKKMKDGKSD